MNKIISKIITIKADCLPPKVRFIENAIKDKRFNPIRWAIVEVDKNILTISVSGYEI